MSHTESSVLAARLKEAEAVIEIGAHYAHYKHPEALYVICGLGLIEENEEVAVIYQQVAGDHLTFIRPLSSFTAEVEQDGHNVLRFSKVER